MQNSRGFEKSLDFRTTRLQNLEDSTPKMICGTMLAHIAQRMDTGEDITIEDAGAKFPLFRKIARFSDDL